MGREVERARQSFEELAELERSGDLSGTAGRGAVFRVLTQKAEELYNLEEQIAAQQSLIEDAFEDGNEILGRMRELTVAPGPVDNRSVQFSEESVKLANGKSKKANGTAKPPKKKAKARSKNNKETTLEYKDSNVLDYLLSPLKKDFVFGKLIREMDHKRNCHIRVLYLYFWETIQKTNGIRRLIRSKGRKLRM